MEHRAGPLASQVKRTVLNFSTVCKKNQLQLLSSNHEDVVDELQRPSLAVDNCRRPPILGVPSKQVADIINHPETLSISTLAV